MIAVEPLIEAFGSPVPPDGRFLSDPGAIFKPQKRHQQVRSSITNHPRNMKGYLSALLVLIVAGLSAQPNTWSPIAGFEGDSRQMAVSFAIADKLYVGTGTDASLDGKIDFWEYDPVNDDWIAKADFEGDARFGAVGFSINGKGYIALGAADQASGLFADIWEYDPVADDWTQKADFEGTARAMAFAFVVGGKAYIGAGQDANGSQNDLWEFDPVANDWIRKTDFPGVARSFVSSFVIGTKGYVGTGADGDDVSLKDFWEYDPSTDQWTQRADFAGEERFAALGFSIDGRGYFGGGGNAGPLNDFWSYDPVADTWHRVADFAGSARFNATATAIDGVAYAGTGTDGTNPLDFFKYEPKVSQTITFGTLAGKTVGDADFALTATSTSLLAVEYESSDPAVATVSGNTVTITGGGTTTITARQPGDNDYFPAAAVEQDLVVAKANQTITFNPLPGKIFGDAAFALTATASSSLAVSYESSNTTVATISGSTVTIVGAGTTTITAKQAGNASYNAAPDETEELVVARANQTITFNALPPKTPADAPFALTATASSGLAISYESSNTGVATISGSTVTIVGAGTTTITAKQPGNTNFNPATDETEELVVAKANQTITFNVLGPKTYGDAPFQITATASSGLAVSLASSNSSVATISGNTITIAGAGSTDITASQAGNAGYNAATPVVRSLTVSKANQSISFATLESKKADAAPFNIAAIASSGLPVTFISSDPAVADVAGNTVTVAQPGKTFITASQPGNSNYHAAQAVSKLLTVTEAFVSAPGQGEMWGIAGGGEGGSGAIFRTNASGTTVFPEYHFVPDANGSNPKYNQMVEAGGKLYGTMQEGGAHDAGVLFEFDPATSIYTPRHAFDGLDGRNPSGKLALASNGKLYGVAPTGGVNNSGTIFEYDIATGTFTLKYSFSSATDNSFRGISPYGGLTAGPDQKLYGMTFTGIFPSVGDIYSFDPATGTVAGAHSFTESTGGRPFGELALVDGKFYGSTNFGGSNNVGSLFEFDPATGAYTVHHNYINSGLGYTDESRNMVLAPNGKLYGTSLGGAGSTTGVIFEFDPATNLFAVKVAFNHNSASIGGGNQAIMSVGSNGKLYGTARGGAHSAGLVFEYDPATGQYQKLFDFNHGGYPASAVTAASNGKLYGMSMRGGAFANGVLWELDLTGNVYAKKLDFSHAINGANPQGQLTMAPNGKYYGIGTGGEHNNGVLFEFDPQTKTYAKKHDFDANNEFAAPLPTLVAAPTGKIYGILAIIGSDAYIYEYDPATGTYAVKFTLNNTTASASGANGDLTYFNGKLYGWTAFGGTGSGILYELDLATSTFTKRLDLSASTGTFNRGGMLLTADGKFYGTMSGGGANGGGTIFELDPLTNVFTKKYDFASATGVGPQGLVQAKNGKLYGATTSGGANNYGVIYEYDPQSNSYSGKYSFNTSTGYNQFMIMAAGSNGKLYGTTPAGGFFGATSSIFEFDPETSNYKQAVSITSVTPVGGLIPGALKLTGSLAFRNSNFTEQTITFDELGTKQYVPTLGLTAVASSGLPVTFTSDNTAVASVSGSTLTLHSIGFVNITASQAGNAQYSSAVPVTRQLTITPGAQTITFDPLPDRVLGGPKFTLAATASSGLPVAYGSTNKVSLAGNEVTLLSAGVATITAFQGGNSFYLSAPNVIRSFCINPAKPAITMSPGANDANVTLNSPVGDGNQWYRNGTLINGATSSSFIATEPGLYKLQVTVETCVSEFSNELPVIVTGAALSDTDLTLRLYPNPAVTDLNIVWPAGSSAEEREVTVYDILGRKVEHRIMSGDEISLDIRQLKEGTYILRALRGAKAVQKRFNKQD